ncbi:hypothetical protein [Porphyromonas gingivalis]|uniref:hypothetical protein n=1 Tax=Porphyromonas gingivalis TaxID=837 RepID=UPI001F2276CE|nr:hypothetical protein [Porphyromonas gingivalis]MCE8165318.1 hypothetical protein [Porphyromonas gingivalis]
MYKNGVGGLCREAGQKLSGWFLFILSPFVVSVPKADKRTCFTVSAHLPDRILRTVILEILVCVFEKTGTGIFSFWFGNFLLPEPK